MPRKRGGNRARAHKLEAPLDVEPYGTNMADVASQPLGIQPSALAIPTSTVSPCHDLAQNTLPNLALFQDSGLGFSSADIGLEETNSLPTSFSSTDHSIKRSHGSPDTVHTAPSEFQSFVKTASTSDDGEKSKLGSVDGSAKRRKTPKVASSTVPLLCSACPGQPQFSDLSHLLTHLGSRGHTKCEFDARVKASTQTDPAAMKAMVEYDLWFKENNISKMLANRMNDKEKKKQEREEGEVAKRKKGPNPSTSSKKRKTNEGEVKREPRENAAIRPAPVGEQFDFHGHGFDFTGNPNNSGSFDFDSGSFSLQPMPYFENDPALENARSPGISFLSDNESEHGNERMKLKGVYWPGMDMFDSATPENKKKRNQRKDSSVVARMMRESSAIQPTLMVCDRNMTIERTRDIYDSATEEEVMPKQPKAKRARTTASKPAIKKEGSVDTPKSASRTRKRQASSAGQAQVHGVTEARVKRGSAALAITKIAEQAQNDFDADLEDNLEEESDRDNDFSSRTRNRARPGRPSRMTQQWPLDLSRTNSSQSYHGSRSTTAGLDGFREDEGDSGVSQLKIEGQTESRFRGRHRLPLQSLSLNSNTNARSDFSSPTPSNKKYPQRMFGGKENNHVISQGITSQHQQNAQAMNAFGMAQNGMKPRSLWPGNMDPPNFLRFPMLSSYGDDVFPDTQSPGSHVAQGNALQGQMNLEYADGLQPHYFQSGSFQNHPWHTTNGLSGTGPNIDQSAFFPGGWMSNDQTLAFDQPEHQSVYDADILNMGNM